MGESWGHRSWGSCHTCISIITKSKMNCCILSTASFPSLACDTVTPSLDKMKEIILRILMASSTTSAVIPISNEDN